MIMEAELETRMENFVQRIVKTTMRRLAAPPSMFEDLLQEGRLSVLKLMRGFDDSFGASPESYCFLEVRRVTMNYVLRYRSPFTVKNHRYMTDDDYTHLRSIQRGLKSPNVNHPDKHIDLYPGVYEILDSKEAEILDRFISNSKRTPKTQAVLDKIRSWYEGQM